MEDQSELQRLLQKVSLGDRSAFHRLYSHTSGILFGVCYRIAGQADVAEEATQEAYVRIWHNASEYQTERGAPLNWMITIARYRTLDILRARRVRDGLGEETLEQLADTGQGPMDTSVAVEDEGRLHRCFDELSQPQQDALMLSYFRGYTHDQLARLMDRPLGSIKSWVRRGLASLKRCLER